MNSIINRARYFANKIKKNIVDTNTLHLYKFKEVKQVYDNNNPMDYCQIAIFDNHIFNNYKYSNYKFAGIIIYRLKTGEICNFHLADDYRNQGLGTSIINNTIVHMKSYGTPYIWVEIDKRHIFWDNVKIKGNHFQWCDTSKNNENRLFMSPNIKRGYQMKIL